MAFQQTRRTHAPLRPYGCFSLLADLLCCFQCSSRNLSLCFRRFVLRNVKRALRCVLTAARRTKRRCLRLAGCVLRGVFGRLILCLFYRLLFVASALRSGAAAAAGFVGEHAGLLVIGAMVACLCAAEGVLGARGARSATAEGDAALTSLVHGFLRAAGIPGAVFFSVQAARRSRRGLALTCGALAFGATGLLGSLLPLDLSGWHILGVPEEDAQVLGHLISSKCALLGRFLCSFLSLGCVAVAYSFAGDAYASTHRFAIATFLAAAQACGALCAELLLSSDRPWHSALLVVAACTLLALLLAAACLREPLRGAAEPEVHELLSLGMDFDAEEAVLGPSSGRCAACSPLRRLLSVRPSLLLLVLHALLRAAAHEALLQNLPASLGAAPALSAFFSFGTAVGCVAGGLAGRLLHGLSPTALAAALAAATYYAPRAALAARGEAAAAAAGALATCGTACVRALALNVCMPGDREMSIATVLVAEAMGTSLAALAGRRAWSAAAACAAALALCIARDESFVATKLYDYLDSRVGRKVRERRGMGQKVLKQRHHWIKADDEEAQAPPPPRLEEQLKAFLPPRRKQILVLDWKKRGGDRGRGRAGRGSAPR